MIKISCVLCHVLTHLSALFSQHYTTLLSRSLPVASFREISRIIAETWKTLEPTTKQYVQDVSNILKARHAELQETRQQEIFQNEAGSNKSRTQTTTTLQMREQKQHQPMPSPVGHWSNNVIEIISEEQAAYPPAFCGDCYDPSNLNEHSSLFMPTTLAQHTTLLNNFCQGNYPAQGVIRMDLFNDASAPGVTQRYDPPSESCTTTDQFIFCSECHH